MKYIHRGRLVGLVIMVGALWSILTLFSDSKEVLISIKHLSYRRVIIVFLLSSINYWIRVVRFNWLTNRVAKAPIRKDINTIIFFSGLSMNLTPMRIGEIVKTYFQHRLFKESFARMAPVVFVERFSDGLAMILMMSFGVFAFRLGVSVFAALIVVVGFVILLFHWRRFGSFAVAVVQRIPRTDRFIAPLQRALFASRRLTSIWPLGLSTLLGVVAWVAEASGLLVLLSNVGVQPTIASLYLTWFTFSVSAAVGFISVLPAGLGVNELSTIGLLERFLRVSYSDALVVTFAFRAVTLWFGVLLGLVSLIYLERQSPST